MEDNRDEHGILYPAELKDIYIGRSSCDPSTHMESCALDLPIFKQNKVLEGKQKACYILIRGIFAKRFWINGVFGKLGVCVAGYYFYLSWVLYCNK